MFSWILPLVSCFAACRVGMFGRNCQQSCGADMNCKGLRFCLPDPYGCSCASGWFGSRCEKGQPASLSAKKQLYWICSTFFLAHCHSCVFPRQPVTTTCTDQTASSAAAARTEGFATASVVVSVRRGGGDATVRNQVPLQPKAKIVALKLQEIVSPLKLLSSKSLPQTGLRRSWIWRVIWKEIWTQAPRFIVPPQATHCPATTA